MEMQAVSLYRWQQLEVSYRMSGTRRIQPAKNSDASGLVAYGLNIEASDRVTSGEGYLELSHSTTATSSPRRSGMTGPHVLTRQSRLQCITLQCITQNRT